MSKLTYLFFQGGSSNSHDFEASIRDAAPFTANSLFNSTEKKQFVVTDYESVADENPYHGLASLANVDSVVNATQDLVTTLQTVVSTFSLNEDDRFRDEVQEGRTASSVPWVEIQSITVTLNVLVEGTTYHL